MIHPFHPLYNQTFPLLDCRLTWGEARVYFHDATDALVHVPAHWTDAAPVDPFVVMSAGRVTERWKAATRERLKPDQPHTTVLRDTEHTSVE